MKPSNPLSPAAFAAAVHMREVHDKAVAPMRAGAEARITDWMTKARDRYLARVDGIPREAAEECAHSCFSLNCMAGTAGNYFTKPPHLWPEPEAAVDEDIVGWRQVVQP